MSSIANYMISCKERVHEIIRSVSHFLYYNVISYKLFQLANDCSREETPLEVRHR